MTERLTPMPGPLTPEERALAARLARLGPHGEPPPALDARILAAARAGVPAAAGSPRNQARWTLALGVAASVALAVGLAWQLRPSPAPLAYDEATSAVGVAASAPAAEAQAVDATSAPEPVPGATTPAQPRATGEDAPQAFQRRAEPAAQVMTKPGHADAGPGKERARRAPPAPPAPAAVTVLQEPAPAGAASAAAAAADMVLPAPPPATPAAAAAKAAAPSPQAVAREAAARDTAADQRARNAAAASATESHAQAADDSFADEPFVEDVPPATADSPAVRDAWLHRIRELQASGDTEAARASLEEFVRRYPSFPLPDDLRPLLD